MRLTEPAVQKGRRLRVKAQGPSGSFVATGQTAKPLLALTGAGLRAITALEMGTWALRLAAYIHVLRHQFGLTVEMERESHDGGWHGRYVLRSPVSIGEAQAQASLWFAAR